MVKIMELKKYKDNNYKRKSYVILVIGFLLLSISSYLFYKSYALYEEKKDFDVINGTVEDPGDIYFAYYVDGVISRNMPLQNTGYTLDEAKSNCNNNVSVKWDNASWEAKVNYKNYSATDNTRTKCTLYFNKTAKTVKTALGNIEVNTYTPDFTKSACDDTSCESHEKGIYETTDTDGKPTYYYRGSVENNYVKFAGFYWRIIRINSNGSIRMIYDGTSAHENGEISDDRQAMTSSFFNNYNNNMYVGYMYEENKQHGLLISSVIKHNNDNFFKNNLNSYIDYLDKETGFCGDRSTLNLQSGVGTGTITTYYKGYLRISHGTPSLSCENTNDFYTITSSNVGNKSLTYPVGLISADEAMLSGYGGGNFNGGYNYQKSCYKCFLTTGKAIWTMTPVGGYNPFDKTYWGIYVFVINDFGSFDDPYTIGRDYSLTPVINIRSDVKITGTGTMTDPYVIK